MIGQEDTARDSAVMHVLFSARSDPLIGWFGGRCCSIGQEDNDRNSAIGAREEKGAKEEEGDEGGEGEGERRKEEKGGGEGKEEAGDRSVSEAREEGGGGPPDGAREQEKRVQLVVRDKEGREGGGEGG